MKKNILSISLLILAIHANAQKSFLFKIKYLPNHLYKSSSEERLFPDITLNTEQFSVRTLTIETDQKNAKGNFPLKMFYTAKQRFKPSQEIFAQLNPKLDKPIYGHTDGEKLTVDSVPGIKNQEWSANDIARIINEFKLDLSFPEKPLRIGESFTRAYKIYIINVAGLYPIPIEISYQLISVKNDIAVFDTRLAMDFNFDWIKGFKAKGTAKGTGKLIFNMAKNYPEYIYSDLEMNYTGSRVSIDIVVDSGPTTLKRIVEIKNEILPK